jgi:glutathione S-transferase
MSNRDWIVLGSELSPFTLKLLAMCRYKGLACRHLPDEGGWLENLRISLRKERLVRGRLQLTWPEFTDEDEFPLVPFLFGPNGENLYDSTAIADWLDRHFANLALVPPDPALAFCVRLLDEFADEWMLYLVHHGRWKLSAADNDAGARLAREMRTVTFGWRWPVRHFFSARQVRRLPYLFSVAPEGFSIPGLPRNRQPPARAGFPPTHALLEGSYRRILLALEAILGGQPCLFGHTPTLADFSIYGQIGMNLSDPSADRFIAGTAPHTHAWAVRMHRHAFTQVPSPLEGRGSGRGVMATTDTPSPPPSPPTTGERGYQLSPSLRPLLAEVCRVYVPLMRQNAAACERFKAQGERRFNEAAFDAGRCLYDGELDGMPFRAVAKSFQAKTWRRLCEAWQALGEAERARLGALLPQNHGLGQYSTPQ